LGSSTKGPFSRIIWLFPLKDKSSEEVANALRTWISWCGQPNSFYSDNGKEFAGEVSDLLANQVLGKIPNIYGRLYDPQTQGSIEVANKTFKIRLSALHAERGIPRNWVSLLSELQEVTNTTSNRQLPGHITPFEV
jgi:hypothetical protein